ncbi:uncharacterized protein BX663DRAFT_480806 [Cokeromyces recurvatus]|uniref:uncharacterized protein n=1 Tax=Cokeromyces recurvatus TaxID=90255 RepID=UPI00221E37F8|nr:uncharacterized protein BX663DRAFT_480806 [Cokeromyces recurvatus]KAI7898023.1 hypothetical protein BX663DRAFT_480806 [Cokeromyces recurvatus]
MSASSNYNNGYNNNYYAQPPPLPHHIEMSQETIDPYGMKNVPVSSPPPYPVYNNVGIGSSPPQAAMRDSLSDIKLMRHYDSDDDMEKIIPRERRKRSCIDKLCCGCCTCCPKWLRWCTCILFIIIVIIAIIIGVLVGIFKVPTVQFTGLEQEPSFAFTNNVLSITFNVGISVDNQNFESLYFDRIKADAYYPSPYNTYIGGGSVTGVDIKSFAVTNIIFPFVINVNSSDPSQQGVIMDLATRCGLDGSAPQKLDFNYYVYPTVKIIGISITPKISKTMSINCPTSELNSILGGLFGGSS